MRKKYSIFLNYGCKEKREFKPFQSELVDDLNDWVTV